MQATIEKREINKRIAKMQMVLSAVAGFACELTIISEKKFSLCATGLRSFHHVTEWLHSQRDYEVVWVETIYDEELSDTFFYFEIA